MWKAVQKLLRLSCPWLVLIGKPSRHHVPPPVVVVEIAVGGGQEVEALAPRHGRIGLRLLPGRQNPGRVFLAEPLWLIAVVWVHFRAKGSQHSMEIIYVVHSKGTRKDLLVTKHIGHLGIWEILCRTRIGVVENWRRDLCSKFDHYYPLIK